MSGLLVRMDNGSRRKLPLGKASLDLAEGIHRRLQIWKRNLEFTLRVRR